MPSSDRILFIGTQDGLYAATPNGDGYHTRLLGLQGTGPVRYPTVDSEDPKRVYVGTATDGMMRSEDGGETWQDINKGILYKEIYSVAQNPATGDLYAGTQPAAVFKSTNGGDSWIDCA